MKKLLTLIVSLLLIVTMAFMAACTPKDVESAKKKMDEAGYIVVGYENKDNDMFYNVPLKVEKEELIEKDESEVVIDNYISQDKSKIVDLDVLIILTACILFIGFIIIQYIFNYNKLQEMNIKINEAENIIDNELRNKYDLIIRSSNIINKLLKKDVTYYKELEKLKKENISNFEIDRKRSEGENLIQKVKNDYVSLEDNNEFNEIINFLKDSDEILEAAKSFYNKYTTEINLIIKKFPTNIIAIIHKIKTRNYFDGKNMFDDEIKDFKL